MTHDDLTALSLEEVAELCPGELHRALWAQEITGVEIDSRRVEEGELFVAVGRGAEFWRQALARGAAAALVPDDVFQAMAALGGAFRSRSSARVVGITGSTGKTSTKDILAALCAPHARTVAAEGSFNNELGIPLTLARIRPSTEIAIVEIGMRGLGQVTEACGFVRPEIGIVTSIGPVHLELMGTVERVAQAKAELLGALGEGGIGVVPANEPLLDPFLPPGLELRSFGPGGDVQLVELEAQEAGARVTCDLRGRSLELEVPFSARYQAENLLAALATYEALGLPLERAQEGAGTIRISRWRGQETALPGEGILINDAYNANPISMRASLEHQVVRAAGRRRVAVLGTMAELGSDSERYHGEIGQLAAELGVAALVAVGEEARAYLDRADAIPTLKWAPDAAAAARTADRLLEPGDCVLVKGSRAVGLELVVETLARVPG
ncbi:MAG: UDP-N-acetylmuramoyl-tripeptide--D-alanyl-D-alanine ligase [Gaiellaceae bacterium]